MSYADLLSRKRAIWHGAGIEPGTLPDALFPWQRAIVRWALRKGRAAIFADCGLGKTPMQLAWAHATGERTLILAPLCVAEQTVHEGEKFGISVAYAPDASHVGDARIVVTNYERLHKFDARAFGAVVLDESSILKSFDGKTRGALIATFRDTPYRLCCTATPAPNDIAELANHAEFLGLMRSAEFLATWFVHDDSGWRMKRHARQPFFRWLASWGLAVRRPSDLGYDDSGFVLPPLEIRDCVVGVDTPAPGMLFAGMTERGIKGRSTARRASMDDRVRAAAELASENEQWILWCGLNDESSALAAAIPDAVEVKGQDAYQSKVDAVRAFTSGSIRVLVTKPRILGFGMNFQNCHSMAFVGLSDSYESYYQCIRRCWRFGQRKPVSAWIVTSESEAVVVENVRRKESQAAAMAEEMLREMRDFEREEMCN